VQPLCAAELPTIDQASDIDAASHPAAHLAYADGVADAVSPAL
jgi:hypothetical protein